jgi:hypothetical protein
MGTLSLVAEVKQLEVGPDTPGAVQCKAPGCDEWFIRASGRHAYCKKPTCTYKRGAPPQAELSMPPEGSAALELLRRLQEREAEEGEVGPSMLVSRVQAVQGALRAADAPALAGALIDVAAVCTAWAERARRGEMPTQSAPTVPGAPVRAEGRGGSQPVGMVHAVLASHQRTYVLGERMVESVWTLIEAQQNLASAEHGLKQMEGGPNEEATRAHLRAARQRAEVAERAVQSLKAAWAERGETLKQLAEAVESASRQPAGAGAARRRVSVG